MPIIQSSSRKEAIIIVFLLVLFCSSLSAQSFSPAVNYSVGSNPLAVASGDFNKDGKPDLVIANQASNTVTVLPNLGGGKFGSGVDYPTGMSPQFVAVGDINSDGNLDIIVANSNSNTVGIFLGNGDGSFQTMSTIVTDTAPVSLVVADLNSDGHLDIAVANLSSSTVTIFFGNGDGSFRSGGKYSVGTNPASITSADLNGDGKLDLVTANGDGSISVLLNAGDGTFLPSSNTSVAVGSLGFIATGDFNEDGRPDLAVLRSGLGGVDVLLGNGDGTFSVPVTHSTNSFFPTSIAIADLNGDGHKDLVITDNRVGTLSVLNGNGQGGFSQQVLFSADTSPFYVIAADFNADGRADLAVANSGANDASILLNSSVPSQGGSVGWRMQGVNSSRTNVTTAKGPLTTPGFKIIATNVSGALRRIALDGSLILVQPLVPPGNVTGTISSYSRIGKFQWKATVASDLFGIQDIALSSFGAVYFTPSATLSNIIALDGDSGHQLWGQTNNTGGRSHPIAIGRDGTIYLVSGTGPLQGKISAISPDGGLKWQITGPESSIALSTDESSLYVLTTKGIAVPTGDVNKYSTADGSFITNTPCDPRGDVYAFAPWNILYTGNVNNDLLGFTPDIQSCPVISVHGMVATGLASTTTTGRLITLNNDGTLGGLDQQGNLLWQSTESLSQAFTSADATVYAVATATNDLVALESEHGKLLWRVHFSDPITGQFLGDDGNIYLTAGTNLFVSTPAPVLGTIVVSTNNKDATFMISDGNGHNFSNSGIAFTQAAPPGTYTIQFGSIPRFLTPLPQTQALIAGGTVMFSGIYQPQPPILQISPTEVKFSSQIIGTPGETQTVNVANVGGSDSHLSINITGYFSESNNCNGDLAAGSSCVVNIKFQPVDEGTFVGTLTFSDLAAGISQPIQLSGIALLPPLTFPLHGIKHGLEQHLTQATAPMNSVFDHHMKNSAGQFMSYGCDGTVEDFREEIGVSTAAKPPCKSVSDKGYPSPDPKTRHFAPTPAYTGNLLLFYDGHPGYDFRSSFDNEVYAAASGIVHYPTLTELRNRDLLTIGGDPDDLHVLEIEVTSKFKIFYLHLSTHPRSVSIPLASSTDSRNDLDFIAKPNSDFGTDRGVTKNIDLHGHLSLSGLVTQDGKPLSNVSVQLVGSTSNGDCVYEVIKTDSSGHYSFTGLVPGNYNIRPISKGLEFDAVHSDAILPEGTFIDHPDTLIAKSGNASVPGQGKCVPPHLHFEIQRALSSPRTFPALGQELNFIPVDPYGWSPTHPDDNDPYFQVNELSGSGLVNKPLWK